MNLDLSQHFITVPHVFSHVFFPILALKNPCGSLLVGQAVQGPRQAAEPRSPGVVRIAQGRAHQVGRVRRDVATWP